MAKKDKKEAFDVQAEEAEVKKAKQIDINCGILFPDYQGARTVSRKYAKISDDKTLCFEMSVPAPQDLAVWEELTGRPAVDTAPF